MIESHQILDFKILDGRKMLAVSHHQNLLICEISSELKYALLDVKCEQVCFEPDFILG